MKPRTYFLICSAVFSVVAAGHLIRLLMGWDVSIAGWPAPQWVSIPGVLVPGVLSVWGLTLVSRARASL